MVELAARQTELQKKLRDMRGQLLFTAGRRISEAAREQLNAEITKVGIELTTINRQMGSYKEPT